MTYEEVKEELIRRGLPKSSVESKYVPQVLDIVYGTDFFVKLSELEAEVAYQERKLALLNRRITNASEAYTKSLYTSKEEIDGCIDYIQGWYEDLCICETPQERDKMKIAQTFVNTCEVKTCYDNTAFITGLGAILSGETMTPIETLKSINPGLFSKMEIPPKQTEWTKKVRETFDGKRVI